MISICTLLIEIINVTCEADFTSIIFMHVRVKNQGRFTKNIPFFLRLHYGGERGGVMSTFVTKSLYHPAYTVSCVLRTVFTKLPPIQMHSLPHFKPPVSPMTWKSTWSICHKPLLASGTLNSQQFKKDCVFFETFERSCWICSNEKDGCLSIRNFLKVRVSFAMMVNYHSPWDRSYEKSVVFLRLLLFRKK